jgi:hypothetical protein
MNSEVNTNSQANIEDYRNYYFKGQVFIGDLTLDDYIVANFGRFESMYRERERERNGPRYHDNNIFIPNPTPLRRETPHFLFGNNTAENVPTPK